MTQGKEKALDKTSRACCFLVLVWKVYEPLPAYTSLPYVASVQGSSMAIQEAQNQPHLCRDFPDAARQNQPRLCRGFPDAVCQSPPN